MELKLVNSLRKNILELVIDKEQNCVYLQKTNDETYKVLALGTIDCAFGNLLYNSFENTPEYKRYGSFIHDNFGSKDVILEIILNDTCIEVLKPIASMKCTLLGTINSIYEFIYTITKGKDEYKPSLDEINMFRIQNKVHVEQQPIEHGDYKNTKGMRFFEIKTIYDVFYGILYYYAYEHLKLKRCEHCGRWFVTTSFKTKYCNRKTTVERYSHLLCKEAAKSMKQECTRVKNRIETKAYSSKSQRSGKNKGAYNKYVEEFQKKCNDYISYIPYEAAENLEAYHSFLRETEKQKGWLK
ncbi:DUF6076 domain-containing protein [Ruminococcus flavefaciens]|uniref:DUF6076 domain-containing protein n=1 Tax=Ruminococcus flavefaciens TaxID=1265 RepID=UPI00048FDE4D|nr:DUF6076 domain-containing protein [Ruminococcus flavefaciens]